MEYPGCRPGRVGPTSSKLWWTRTNMTLGIAHSAKELLSCLANGTGFAIRMGWVYIEAVQFY